MEQQVKNCPFADVNRTRKEIIDSGSECPFHKIVHESNENNNVSMEHVHLKLNFFNYQRTVASARLLKDIGGGDRIREMTTRFYAHTFEDRELHKFIFMGDGAAAHGKRIGDWIVEKMGGEGDVWTDSGRKDMRQVSHHKAWYSDKRPREEQGRRFKLPDCRIWMRLMFWSARECGLDQHEAFFDWYVKFIGHFIGIYEITAPPYATESAEWSGNKANIERYRESGYLMEDVLRNRQ